MSVDTGAVTHWWAGASYGADGAWAHVPNEDVAPWMLLMVIVFGLIYAVDAVVASIAVLTTLRDPPRPAHADEDDHPAHHAHSHPTNQPFKKSPFVGTAIPMQTLQPLNLSKRTLGVRT